LVVLTVKPASGKGESRKRMDTARRAGFCPKETLDNSTWNIKDTFDEAIAPVAPGGSNVRSAGAALLVVVLCACKEPTRRPSPIDDTKQVIEDAGVGDGPEPAASMAQDGPRTVVHDGVEYQKMMAACWTARLPPCRGVPTAVSGLPIFDIPFGKPVLDHYKNPLAISCVALDGSSVAEVSVRSGGRDGRMGTEDDDVVVCIR
jgi:hypothetical protein